MDPILTDRLILRNWIDGDLDALVQLHQNPEVAYWLAGSLSREQVTAMLESTRKWNDEHECGVRAVCLADGQLIGAAGLQRVKPGMPFSGIEATWRLFPQWWGQGFITEAMKPMLAQGFATMELEEIVTFTAQQNLRSQAVMRRLGFVADPARDFDHPKLPRDHPLRRHVFFRLPAAQSHEGDSGESRASHLRDTGHPPELYLA